MLDADLAALYDVDTRVLVQAVKRNIERFPKDFMFQLLIRLEALVVDSSSVSGILLRAKPAAESAARAPILSAKGAELGTIRRTPASTALITRSAARIEKPMATP